MIPSTRIRCGALLSVAAVITTALSGCSPQRLSGTCGIVVDGSGSGDNATGFNVDKQAKDNVDKYLRETECDRVVFAPISGASQSSYCQAQPIDIDPAVTGNVDRKRLWAAGRAKALKQTLDLRQCIRTDPRSTGGSDVLGGLAAVEQRRPAGATHFSVLVISDFMQTDKSVNLYQDDLRTPAKRAALIEKIAKEGRVPNLSGMRLSAAGYGLLQSKDPTRYAGFDLFWRQLLKERAKVTDPLTIL